jgi:hypothetical protein
MFSVLGKLLMTTKSVLYGVLLGVLVAGWTFVMGFTGWYRDPIKLNLFFLVIPMQIAVVLKCLAVTARLGAAYGRQIGNGMILSVVASGLIFCGSLMFTRVVFPTYFDDLKQAHAGLLRQAGTPEADIQKAVDAAAEGQTSMSTAVQGVVGTLGTGLVTSMIAAIWLRSRQRVP